MKKKEIIEGLSAFRNRLLGEVVNSCEQRGGSFGRDRFNTWRRKLTQFSGDHMPREIATLNRKFISCCLCCSIW